MEDDFDHGFFMDQEPPPLRLVSVAKYSKPTGSVPSEDHSSQLAMEPHRDHGLVCGLCGSQSDRLEAYQEHLTGNSPCASRFAERGCSTCLLFFASQSTRDSHSRLCPSAMAAGFLQSHHASVGTKASCDWSAGGVGSPSSVLESRFLDNEGGPRTPRSGPAAVAIVCETVGGGMDGSVDIVARVCAIDERENVLIDTIVQPSLPVTTFRDTGLCSAVLEKGVPFRIVRRQVLSVLFTGSVSPSSDLNTEPVSHAQRRPRLLGHNLEHHLECLMIDYPEELMRDTATYPPLLKACGSPNTLSTLAHNQLRLDLGPRERRDLKKEALASLRLYHLFRTAPPGHRCDTLGNKRGEARGATASSLPSFGASLGGKLQNASSERFVNAKQKRELHYSCWCMD